MTKLPGIPVLILNNLFKFLGCVIVWMAFRRCIHCDQTYDDVFNVRTCSTQCSVNQLTSAVLSSKWSHHHLFYIDDKFCIASRLFFHNY